MELNSPGSDARLGQGQYRPSQALNSLFPKERHFKQSSLKLN